MSKMNTENLKGFPQIDVSDDLLKQINPFINTDPDFNPYEVGSGSVNEFIPFDSIIDNINFSHEELFLIVNHYLSYPSNLHYHDFIEVLYVGSERLLNIIDGKPYVMEAHDFCLIPAGVSHLISTLPEDEKNDELPLVVNLLIHPQLIQHLGVLADTIRLEKNTTLAPTEPIIIQHKISSAITHYVQRLILEFYQADFHLNQTTLGNLIIFLDKLSQHKTYEEQQLSTLTKECLFLIKSDPQTVSMTKLASRLNYSQGHLSRTVKKDTGKTIAEHIAEARLTEAIRLLSETESTISDISDQVGYQSESHLYRSFKRSFKMTPTQYRNLMRS